MKYLNNNLVKDFIRLNHSFVILLILFARKLNKDLNLYINHRVFNAIIIKNRYSLLLIQEILSRIYKIRIYIIFNIIVVFDKLRMIEKKMKTAFKTRCDLYKSFIINFDSYKPSSFFQNYINDVLYEYFDNFYITYINNILIYNKNRKKYIRYIRLIL